MYLWSADEEKLNTEHRRGLLLTPELNTIFETSMVYSQLHVHYTLCYDVPERTYFMYIVS